MPKTKTQRMREVTGHNPNMRRDDYRLPLAQKAAIKRATRRGLGTPFVKPNVRLPAIDFEHRFNKIERNRRNLEAYVPGVFEQKFFVTLPILGSGSEGEVRRLFLGGHNKFVTSEDNQKGPHRWASLAIKKFRNASTADIQKQVETLHSLNLIRSYWRGKGKWDPWIRVAEAITFKWPFLVMRDLSGANFVPASKLPPHLKEQVSSEAKRMAEILAHPDQDLIRHFEKAGYTYPGIDFILNNFIAHLDNQGRIDNLWIYDQVPSPRQKKEAQKFRKEGWKRAGRNLESYRSSRK